MKKILLAIVLLTACKDNLVEPVNLDEIIKIKVKESALVYYKSPVDFLYITFRGTNDLFYCPVIGLTTVKGTAGALWLPEDGRGYRVKLPSGTVLLLQQVSCDSNHLTVKIHKGDISHDLHRKNNNTRRCY